MASLEGLASVHVEVRGRDWEVRIFSLGQIV